MSEKCPLKAGQQYWDNQIPEVCHTNCFDKWDGISRNPPLHFDVFSEGCEKSPDKCLHEVELNGEVLQRAPDTSDTWRGYGLNYACVQTAEELWAEDYEFQCDNNDPNVPRARNPFDTFLEPWSIEDCEKIGVDLGIANKISELLYGNMPISEAYEEMYRLTLGDNNQQTHIHIMDTLIRLQYVYQLSEDEIQAIVSRVNGTTQ